MLSQPSWCSSSHRASWCLPFGCDTRTSAASATCVLQPLPTFEPHGEVDIMTRQFLGLDVGGSSIKAGLVDLDAGRLVGDLISAPTPQPASPASMLPVFAGLAGRLTGPHSAIGIAFPS